MSTYNGRSARVTVNALTTEAIVTELGSFTINMSAADIDTTAFGDGWGKSDVGMKTWSGSMSGFADPTDTTGQDVIETAYTNGTIISDIRWYIQYTTTSGESLIYYKPDTASDANAGIRITGWNISQDKNGVATLEISFSGSGPVTQVTSTVA